MPGYTMHPRFSNTSNNEGYRFLESVERFTIKDLNVMAQIAVMNQANDKNLNSADPAIGTGRCTTGMASLCFATIEQLGLILTVGLNNLNDQDLKKQLKYGNVSNAKTFFNYFHANGLQLINPEEVDITYMLYRNKITHNLFPKNDLGVSYSINNILINNIIFKHGNDYVLNVNFLSKYVQDAVSILKKNLLNNSNVTLINQTEDNIMAIQHGEDLILKAQYNNNPNLQSRLRTILPSFPF